MSATLETVTKEQTPDTRWSRPVGWYRTPLAPAVLNSLHKRSDLFGFLQAGGWFGLVVATGSLAFYSLGRWPWWAFVLLWFLHCTCLSFHPSAVHELGHGTVFRTRWLNALFERVIGFFGWNNFQMFDVSHVRHHQFTLHPPDDLEVVLPTKIKPWNLVEGGFVNWKIIKYHLTMHFKLASGNFDGEWAQALFPPTNPRKQRDPVLWSRILLIGHGLIFAGSLVAGFYDYRFWFVPLLVTFAPFCCAWLHNLCALTQHIGLQDNVPDFRLCCRSIQLNPVVRFLYWHMNYHTEHHMYAAVPCYKLGKLQRAIHHDLPPPAPGIIAAWREIFAILKIQEADPNYQHVVICPAPQPKNTII